ncbi:hypothetical protein J5N97_029200 [Dioscorea zingiberensis]|uniref:EF-hand domain-containing protein n=1 Tax=Dioscorea zingiberensis TaxID=325984 RepID=A0A9D5C0A3_9LILI|nr:hypothetical protein J5N97_029200 [Dioscorea zingiberensis]
MAGGRGPGTASGTEEGSEEYEDLMPAMADKLGASQFVAELCGGFRLLADPTRGLITPESLRRNCALLGMPGMSAGDAEGMVREGDLDGDGALNQTEFCILMIRKFMVTNTHHNVNV